MRTAIIYIMLLMSSALNSQSIVDTIAPFEILNLKGVGSSLYGVFLEGRATGDEAALMAFNSFTLNMSSPKTDELTFCHELGHAKYILFHPDDASSVGDNLTGTYDDDDKNFMNSGTLPNPSSLDAANVRQYQWSKIHKNH